jgi:hypothetical protein
LELFGESVWRTVLLEEVWLDQTLPRNWPQEFLTNRKMEEWCLGLDLKPVSGASFEKHIGDLFLKKGINPVRILRDQLCKK